MTTETSRLRLPYLSGAQAQKHVTVNEALLMLDALVAARALDKDEVTPPGDAVDGDGYIVPASATDDWEGWSGSFAQMEDGAWRRYLPFDGMLAWVGDEGTFYVYDAAGEEWLSFVSGPAGRAGIALAFNDGVDTSADPGAGRLRLNHATVASVSEVAVSDLDVDMLDHQADLLAWDDGTSAQRGHLTLRNLDGVGFARFAITGASVDGTGFVRLAVAHVASGGSFAADDRVDAVFARVGDKGDTGPTGTTGATGPTGPGVPSGGSAAQALLKSSGTDYATAWTTLLAAHVSDFTEAAQDAVGAMAADTATIDVTYADATPALTWDVKDNAVSDAKLRDSAAVSVIGRSANSSGDPADIAAGANDTVLRRVSNALGFGQLTVGMLPNDLVTYAKLQNVSATDRLLGRATSGAGDVEEIACTAAGRALLDDADTAAQRNTLASGWGVLLPETRALVNAMTTEPRRARTFLIDDTIAALVDSGLWAKLDALWVMAAHSGQAGKLNWKNPGTWTLTPTNSPTFTTDAGYAGDAASAHLRAGVNWNALSQFTLNSHHVGAWIGAGTDAAADKAAVGGLSGSSPAVALRPRDAAGNLSAQLGAGFSNLGASASILGHKLVTRRGAAEVEGYGNGVSNGTNTTASSGLPNTEIVTHQRNGADYSDFQLRVVHVGAGLSDAEAADLHTILNDYLTGL